MWNGNGGEKHDTLTTLLAALGAFGAWFIRFAVTRYFDRKDKAKEQKRQRELELLLEADIREHHKTKSHTPDK